jgi:hypothetical protein
MAEMTAAPGPNRRIGSIEHVGSDGFIVESVDINDPSFIGGKRLFPNFDELLRFLAEHLQVYKGKGNTYGIKPRDHQPPTVVQDQGGNGVNQPQQAEQRL